MGEVITYLGIDAHKKDLFVAMLSGREKTPVTWQLANEPTSVRRLVRKLEREAPGPVRVFYEAGPCGYALQRQLTTPRVSGDVVAPALIPRKPGERVKTNRRDARKLAELGRAGLLTAVQPPTPEDEAVRDLARARDDAREDLPVFTDLSTTIQVVQDHAVTGWALSPGSPRNSLREGVPAVQAVGRCRRRADRPPQQRSAQAAPRSASAFERGECPATLDFIGRTRAWRPPRAVLKSTKSLCRSSPI